MFKSAFRHELKCSSNHTDSYQKFYSTTCMCLEIFHTRQRHSKYKLRKQQQNNQKTAMQQILILVYPYRCFYCVSIKVRHALQTFEPRRSNNIKNYGSNKLSFGAVVPWFVWNLWYNVILSNGKQICFLGGLHSCLLTKIGMAANMIENTGIKYIPFIVVISILSIMLHGYYINRPLHIYIYAF